MEFLSLIDIKGEAHAGRDVEQLELELDRGNSLFITFHPPPSRDSFASAAYLRILSGPFSSPSSFLRLHAEQTKFPFNSLAQEAKRAKASE